jgi:hypothetical protein
MVDDLPWWATVAEERRGGMPVSERLERFGGALCELAIHLNSPILALASMATMATSGAPWARFMAPYTRSTTPPDTV